MLACRHLFHFECVKKRVEAGWGDGRIGFTYLKCPLCAELLDHSALTRLIRPALDLMQSVYNKIWLRIDIDALRMDDRV